MSGRDAEETDANIVTLIRETPYSSVTYIVYNVNGRFIHWWWCNICGWINSWY